MSSSEAIMFSFINWKEQKNDSIIEVGHLFLENWTPIVYLCNEIKKSIKEEVDQFGWS